MTTPTPEDNMARAKNTMTGTVAHRRVSPAKLRAAPLPGMEDHAIKPLDDIAAEYAEIRDDRMALTQRERAAKTLARKLMKKYDKTIYRHDGIEITIVPGEDDVKVRVKKHEDKDDDQADGVAFTEAED